MTPTQIAELEAKALAATPGPWKSRGLGGDSILLAPTHRWHKPYVYPEDGHPIAVPRLYPDMDAEQNNDGSRPMRVDFSSAGFSHDDAAFIAAANPQAILSLIARVRKAEAALVTRTNERDGEREARERCSDALREKDAAMGVLFKRLSHAGVDCSDLIS